MRDLMGLMKQAQAMQEKMTSLQAELDNVEVQGSSGGGMVSIVMSAKGAVKKVSIDPAVLNPDEKEIVEDLVLAAINDARVKAERTMQERMSELTKGLPLPPGLNLF